MNLFLVLVGLTVNQLQNKISNNTNNRLINVIAIIFLFLYPLIFKTFQGIDFSDQGYYYTCYQLIFTHPEDLKATFIIWLSNIIGGLWYSFFHTLGMPAMQLSGAITVYLTLYLSYQALKRHIPQTRLLLTLLASEIVIYSFNFPVNYNNLTALFYVLMAYLFCLGLERKQNALIFFTGVIATANIFIRFPNILGIALLLMILIYEYKYQSQNKLELVHKVSWLIAGCLTGLLTILLMMHTLGHLEIFVDSLKSIFQAASSTQDSHGIKSLILYLINDYKKAIFSTIVILLFVLLTAVGMYFLSQRIKPGRIYFVWLFVCLYILFNSYDPIKDYAFFMHSLAFLVLLLCSVSFFQSQSSHEKTFILLAIGIAVITPMGSNNGLSNSNYGLWLALPLAIESLLNKISFISHDQNTDNNKNLILVKIHPHILQQSQLILLSILFCTAFIHDFKYTYRDSLNRLELVYPLKHPVVKGIYTHQERAILINELLSVLATKLKDEEKLFAFGNLPMIHYLTNSRPYLPHPWPNLLSYDALKSALIQASTNSAKLPIVLLHKYEVSHFNWPREKRKFKDKKDLIQAFLTSHDYDKVWENDFFEIWQTN